MSDASAALADDVGEEAPKKKGSFLMGLLGVLAVTLLAGGAGAGIGIYLAGAIEATVTEKLKEKPEDEPQLLYSGDMVLQPVGPVVVNVADPSDVWVRLETSIVFPNGALENPEVTAGEIREDIMAFVRTMPLSQFQGPSALQHLRDDLNDRSVVRTNGKVSELIIETMVVQ
ncbi:flagellar basal body-associated FliL family protein [Afifella sp. H1R]|uniref:flagellar basal body-associated FliL family protein n=1 Tax=Afifella sp. H1R TaxID=2908841 RepID=UPI001F2139DB|nr:flagellar basal body-associated FliL family protein [Afifella sp. H1R]MCF1503821.1 flagellar basal body-associated FliL family protein [Afifella sp. H1R]